MAKKTENVLDLTDNNELTSAKFYYELGKLGDIPDVIRVKASVPFIMEQPPGQEDGIFMSEMGPIKIEIVP